jgi:hypothetical protein
MTQCLLRTAMVMTLGVVISAQVSDQGMRAIENYRAAISAAEAARPGALERAYAALREVSDTVQPDLERLTPDAYALVTRQLRGAIVNRTGTVFIQADTAFYAQLAGTRGDAADKGFFTALRATYPNSVWPIYVQQMTEHSGCTRFGSLSLVESYATWTQFTRRFPARYREAANDEIEALHELLTDGTCACGTVADVQRELMTFNTRFTMSPIRGEIDARLGDIRRGQSGVRESCRPG